MGYVYTRITASIDVLYCCNTEVKVGSLADARVRRAVARRRRGKRCAIDCGAATTSPAASGAASSSRTSQARGERFAGGLRRGRATRAAVTAWHADEASRARPHDDRVAGLRRVQLRLLATASRADATASGTRSATSSSAILAFFAALPGRVGDQDDRRRAVRASGFMERIVPGADGAHAAHDQRADQPLGAARRARAVRAAHARPARGGVGVSCTSSSSTSTRSPRRRVRCAIASIRASRSSSTRCSCPGGSTRVAGGRAALDAARAALFPAAHEARRRRARLRRRATGRCVASSSASRRRRATPTWRRAIAGAPAGRASTTSSSHRTATPGACRTAKRVRRGLPRQRPTTARSRSLDSARAVQLRHLPVHGARRTAAMIEGDRRGTYE